MTLAERLAEFVHACFTAIWVQSHEHHDALDDADATLGLQQRCGGRSLRRISLERARMGERCAMVFTQSPRLRFR